MKKYMRFAAILAGAVMLCSSVTTVPVSALWWWGNASGEEFQDMKELDDKGMFKWVGGGGTPGTSHDYQVYTKHIKRVMGTEEITPHTDQPVTEPVTIKLDQVYVIKPRENVLRIVLRKELDHDVAEQKMFEILEKYYPGITEFSQNNNYETNQKYFVNQVTMGVTDLASVYDLFDKPM